MSTECYRCGEPGHYARDCASLLTAHRTSPVPPRKHGAPPTEEYLAERERLGIPSGIHPDQEETA